MRYFAFGSNMSRARLEARVGRVVDLGWAIVEDWRHRFSKRGSDGTGKGNIEPSSGQLVYGVAYRLTFRQLEHLATFETGYELVHLPMRLQESIDEAATFVARPPVPPLCPAPSYIEHYLTGMHEHEIPRAYVDQVLRAYTRMLGPKAPQTDLGL